MSDKSASAKSGTPQRHAGLRIIAIYEVIKTICLLLVAAAAFHLNHAENFERLVQWLKDLPLDGSSNLRWTLVTTLVDFGPSKFVAVGLVTLAYAVLFAIEGIGLWMGKHWAEWFTVIATGSLIPLEIYELFHRFGWLKLIVLLSNVAIVIYLTRVALQPRSKR